MRALANSEREALKAHIKSLEEEVAFLRGLHAPQLVMEQGPDGPPMETGKLWISDEEDEAQELYDAGIIDKDELNGILMASGAMTTDIDFTPTS